jgi:hypothetical protein
MEGKVKKPEDFLSWAKEKWPSASSVARSKISTKVRRLTKQGKFNESQMSDFFRFVGMVNQEMRKS